jgi:hypothetical protein
MHMWRMRPYGQPGCSSTEDGQAMIEWIGVLVLVAVIVAGVVSLGVGSKLASGLKHGVACVLQSCPASGSPASGSPGSNGPGSGQPVPVASITSTTPAATPTTPVTTTMNPSGVCGQGGVPLTGPLAVGTTRPCVSTSTGAQCTPEAVPPLLPSCVPLGSASSTPTPTPVPQDPLPTPDSPWTTPNNGGGSCPTGYDFHVYEGQPWCANSTLDLDPGKLDESPWETNRNDFEPGGFSLICGSANTTGCSTLPTDLTPWSEAQKYYECYNEGGEDCDPPKYLPVVAPRDPSDDPDDPAHGYQVFPYGKPQEAAYNEIMEHAEKLIEGIHDGVEAKQELEERLEEAAMARVSSEAWVRQYVPDGDDAPDSDPEADGDGEDDGG